MTASPILSPVDSDGNLTNNSSNFINSKIMNHLQPKKSNNFDNLFEKVMNELKEDFSTNFISNFNENEQEILSERFKQFFDHSVFGGKLSRSRLGFAIYECLKPDATKIELKQALTVILTIELLQATFLVVDDIMDGGETRRGKPCWHRIQGIGNMALNHALRLQNYVNLAILKTIPNHKNLLLILKTVWETIQTTSDGQELDGISCTSTKYLNFERYKQIVENKTSRYTFYHPISIGLYLADETTYLSQVLNISNMFGYYFQVQDDYLDFLDNDELTGKTSCDIQEGKCTWFSCKTIEILSKTNEKKYDLFINLYGKNDEKSIKDARKIMLECNLIEEYEKFQNEQIIKLKKEIINFPLKNIHSAFEFILSTFQKRTK